MLCQAFIHIVAHLGSNGYTAQISWEFNNPATIGGAMDARGIKTFIEVINFRAHPHYTTARLRLSVNIFTNFYNVYLHFSRIKRLFDLRKEKQWRPI